MRIGVDVGRFAAAAYDVPGQAAWRARAGSRYILASGRLTRQNGFLDLLEAHATLVQEQPALADVRLVIAGIVSARDVTHAAELNRRAGEVGTDPLFLGPVPAEDFPALVAGASAFAYLPTDGTSCTSALEALAAGVPVIARDLPEVRAVLRDVVVYGDTALSIADALVEVLTDPPEPEPGVALAMSLADGSGEDGVVEQEPDRGDRREK